MVRGDHGVGASVDPWQTPCQFWWLRRRGADPSGFSMSHPDPLWWPLLWNSGTVALAVLGPDRRYRAVNEALCRLLEGDAATLSGWSYERVGHPLDLDAELDALVRLAADASTVTYVRRFRTAREREVNATVQAFAGADDHIMQVIIPAGAVSPPAPDVHARKRLEQLAAALSHDAQEPVRQMGVSAGVLNERLEPLLSTLDRDRSVLLGMERNAVRLNRQLRALVRFARLGAPVIDPVPCPLRRLVDRACEQVPFPAGVTLDDTIPNTVSLRCDGEQIITALVELLRNALAAHVPARPTRVTLGLEQGQGHLTVSVIDDNVGIATVDLPRLGKLFATSGPGAGAGVGLALVRAIAEAHGGELKIASTQGVGTVVRLSLAH